MSFIQRFQQTLFKQIKQFELINISCITNLRKWTFSIWKSILCARVSIKRDGMK